MAESRNPTQAGEPTSNEELLAGRIKPYVTPQGHTWILRKVSPFDFFKRGLLPLGRQVDMDPAQVLANLTRDDTTGQQPTTEQGKQQKVMEKFMACFLEEGVLKSDRRRRKRIVFHGIPNEDDDEISVSDMDPEEVTDLFNAIEEWSDLRKYVQLGKKKTDSEDQQSE